MLIKHHISIFVTTCIILIRHVTQASIDADLIRSLSTLKNTQDVLVSFAGLNGPVLKAISEMSFPSRTAKIDTLVTSLQLYTDEMQFPVVSLLQSLGVECESFWVSNQMIIKNANLFILQLVDTFSQVSRIHAEPVIKIAPIKGTTEPQTLDTTQWNVEKIEADEVWDLGITGHGCVVASIDTGVRYTHEALRQNWRSECGWFDPYNNSTTPSDNNGHGTHTMGTMVGKKGIGVMPDGKWIACKGCDGEGCKGQTLLACGQWMCKPCNKAHLCPDVVSNSWGSLLGGDDWYNGVVKAWKAAGILHAFAFGNSGPACFSGGSPGDQLDVLAVGSTDINDRLSYFSSKGPVFFSLFSLYLKPDVCAPGSNVFSAWNTSDTAYETISGTSMATPHVAATMGLMRCVWKTIDFDTAVHIIERTTDKTTSLATVNTKCDDLLGINSTKYPNCQFGFGRINAWNAVVGAVAAEKMMSDAGKK